MEGFHCDFMSFGIDEVMFPAQQRSRYLLLFCLYTDLNGIL